MEAAALPEPRAGLPRGTALPTRGISLARLLGWQLFLGWVGVARGGRGRIWRRLLVGGLGALWLALLGFGVYAGLEQAAVLYPQAAWLPEFCLQSAWLAAMAATLFLNLGFLLHLLFFSPDLGFLMAAPVDARRVMLVRFVEGMGANLGLVALLALPTTLAVGLTVDAPLAYYLLIPPALLFFLTLPVALTFLIGIPLARYWSAARLRAFFSITGFACALALWALPYQMAARQSDRALWELLIGQAAVLQGLLESTWGFLLPSTWVAAVSVQAARGETGAALAALARLGILAGVVTALCVGICAGLYREGWIQLTAVDQNRRTRTPEWWRRIILLPPPHRAFLIKDICLIGRDFRLTFQLYSIGALLAMFPLVVLLSRGSPVASSANSLLTLTTAIGACVVVACQAGMMVVPVEGRAGYRLVAAPLPRHELALTKWLAALTLTLPVVLLQWPLARFGFGSPTVEAFRATGLAFCGAMLGSAFGLLLGAALPNFNWDHPKRMVQPLAQLIWAVGVGVIVLAMAIIGQLEQLMGSTLAVGWLLPGLSIATVVVAGGGAAAAIMVAGRLLAELEWPN